MNNVWDMTGANACWKLPTYSVISVLSGQTVFLSHQPESQFSMQCNVCLFVQCFTCSPPLELVAGMRLRRRSWRGWLLTSKFLEFDCGVSGQQCCHLPLAAHRPGSEYWCGLPCTGRQGGLPLLSWISHIISLNFIDILIYSNSFGTHLNGSCGND